LSVNLRQYAYGGAIAGGLAAIVGIVTYKLFSIPAGPAVIISSTGLFLFSVVLKRK
jgi:ABC-type Mn2+/Zn2+ transport system permease subunit